MHLIAFDRISVVRALRPLSMPSHAAVIVVVVSIVVTISLFSLLFASSIIDMPKVDIVVDFDQTGHAHQESSRTVVMQWSMRILALFNFG